MSYLARLAALAAGAPPASAGRSAPAPDAASKAAGDAAFFDPFAAAMEAPVPYAAPAAVTSPQRAEASSDIPDDSPAAAVGEERRRPPANETERRSGAIGAAAADYIDVAEVQPPPQGRMEPVDGRPIPPSPADAAPSVADNPQTADNAAGAGDPLRRASSPSKPTVMRRLEPVRSVASSPLHPQSDPAPSARPARPERSDPSARAETDASDEASAAAPAAPPPALDSAPPAGHPQASTRSDARPFPDAPPPRAEQADAPPASVEVRIGDVRIEVVGETPPAVPPRRRSRAPDRLGDRTLSRLYVRGV